MKHPQVSSIEVLGALPLSQLNDLSVYGNKIEPIEQLDAFDRVAARRSQAEAPRQVLYVNQLPDRSSTPDCMIAVGFIAAWETPFGVAQGALFRTVEDAVDFAGLALKGLHSTRAYLYRAASIVGKSHNSAFSDRSVIVDAEAEYWRPGLQIHWAPPLNVVPVKLPQ